jgi:transposase
MSRLLVSDELWALAESILPPHPPRPKGGKPPVDDRVCLTGIVFVLKTGIPWEERITRPTPHPATARIRPARTSRRPPPQ